MKKHVKASLQISMSWALFIEIRDERCCLIIHVVVVMAVIWVPQAMFHLKEDYWQRWQVCEDNTK